MAKNHKINDAFIKMQEGLIDPKTKKEDKAKISEALDAIISATFNADAGVAREKAFRKALIDNKEALNKFITPATEQIKDDDKIDDDSFIEKVDSTPLTTNYHIEYLMAWAPFIRVNVALQSDASNKVLEEIIKADTPDKMRQVFISEEAKLVLPDLTRVVGTDGSDTSINNANVDFFYGQAKNQLLKRLIAKEPDAKKLAALHKASTLPDFKAACVAIGFPDGLKDKLTVNDFPNDLKAHAAKHALIRQVSAINPKTHDVDWIIDSLKDIEDSDSLSDELEDGESLDDLGFHGADFQHARQALSLLSPEDAKSLKENLIAKGLSLAILTASADGNRLANLKDIAKATTGDEMKGVLKPDIFDYTDDGLVSAVLDGEETRNALKKQAIERFLTHKVIKAGDDIELQKQIATCQSLEDFKTLLSDKSSLGLHAESDKSLRDIVTEAMFKNLQITARQTYVENFIKEHADKSQLVSIAVGELQDGLDSDIGDLSGIDIAEKTRLKDEAFTQLCQKHLYQIDDLTLLKELVNQSDDNALKDKIVDDIFQEDRLKPKLDARVLKVVKEEAMKRFLDKTFETLDFEQLDDLANSTSVNDFTGKLKNPPIGLSDPSVGLATLTPDGHVPTAKILAWHHLIKNFDRPGKWSEVKEVIKDLDNLGATRFNAGNTYLDILGDLSPQQKIALRVKLIENQLGHFSPVENNIQKYEQLLAAENVDVIKSLFKITDEFKLSDAQLEGIKKSVAKNLFKFKLINMGIISREGNEHKALCDAFAALPLEKQQELLKKDDFTQQFAELTQLKDPIKIQNRLSSLGINESTANQRLNPSDVLTENKRLSVIRGIHNPKLAQIVANLGLTLDETKVKDINKLLYNANNTAKDENELGGNWAITLPADMPTRNYSALVNDIHRLCGNDPHQKEAFNRAFGLSSDGAKVDDYEVQKAICKQQEKNELLLNKIQGKEGHERLLIIETLLEFEPKDNLNAHEIEKLINAFNDAKDLADFKQKLQGADNPTDKLPSAFWKSLTPNRFKSIHVIQEGYLLQDNSKYQGVLTRLNGELEKHKTARKVIDEIDGIKGFDEMCKWFMTSSFENYLNPDFGDIAKKHANQISGKVNKFDEMVSTVLQELEYQQQELKARYDALPELAKIQDPAHRQKVLEYGNDLVAQYKSNEKLIEKYQAVYEKLHKGQDASDYKDQGILKRIAEAKKADGSVVFTGLKVTDKPMSELNDTLAPSTVDGAFTGATLDPSADGKYQKATTIPEGQFREYTDTFNEGKFVEVRKQPESGPASDEVKVHVTTFPKDDPQKAAAFSLNVAKQTLINLKKPPTKENPLVLRCKDPEEAKFLWQALVTLGQSGDPNMKFDANAITCLTPGFSPPSSKRTIRGDSINSMVKEFKTILAQSGNTLEHHKTSYKEVGGKKFGDEDHPVKPLDVVDTFNSASYKSKVGRLKEDAEEHNPDSQFKPGR
jgi:hypothetical protein